MSCAAGVPRLPEPLDEAAEHVANPDHPEQVVALDDRQVPDLPLAHQPGGIEHGDADVDGERLARHHVADPNSVEVGALTREAEHVALGEDADEPAAVADGDRADAFLEHSQHGKPRGVVGVHRHHPRPHDVADRHVLVRSVTLFTRAPAHPACRCRADSRAGSRARPSGGRLRSAPSRRRGRTCGRTRSPAATGSARPFPVFSSCRKSESDHSTVAPGASFGSSSPYSPGPKCDG